jgi:hypothetical protein
MVRVINAPEGVTAPNFHYNVIRAAAWERPLRWTRRILVLASPSGLWTMVMLLAAAAFVARRRRKARHRLRWENDDPE